MKEGEREPSELRAACGGKEKAELCPGGAKIVQARSIHPTKNPLGSWPCLSHSWDFLTSAMPGESVRAPASHPASLLPFMFIRSGCHLDEDQR